MPKNTLIIVNQNCIMFDEKNWNDPLEFKPKRFLDEHGKYYLSGTSAFLPFSVGRRICPGQSLAMAYILMVLIRLLQITQDYEIKVQGIDKSLDILEPNPVLFMFQIPKNYEIAFIKKD